MVQAMIWPLVILIMFLVFVFLFREPLGGFVGNLQNLRVKGGPGGVEISAAAAVGNLALAEATRDAPTAMSDDLIKQIRDLTETPRRMRRLSDAIVLWVDDRPKNNIYERAALEALGIRFVISLSTDDALAKIRKSRFDAIISDMGRPEGAHAGYDLLAKLRKSGNQSPFIIYAGSNLQEHKDLARARGAQGSTNRPQELFQLVIGAVQGTS